MSALLNRVLTALRKMSWTEWLVVIAIICVVVALSVPPVQWGSSGVIVVPVRVIVFDAAIATPIKGAKVLIVRSPPAEVDGFMTDLQARVPASIEDYPEEHRSVTDANGQAIFKYKFRTGAVNKHPIPSAHLSFYWVVVQAHGYGGSVTPLRYESVPNKELRQRGELIVPVGLLLDVSSSP